MSPHEKMLKALNRLAKWRMFFAGWQLGTRPKGDPECDAVRHHREQTMILRAEVSGLTALLVKHGVFTGDEFREQIAEEADALSEAYAKQWRGVRATDDGLAMDPAIIQEHGTMEGWKP